MTATAVRAARTTGVATLNPVAKLLAALLIALPLVVTIDPVSAGVALVLELPLLLAAGVVWRRFWVRTLPLWIAAPATAVTISCGSVRLCTKRRPPETTGDAYPSPTSTRQPRAYDAGQAAGTCLAGTVASCAGPRHCGKS